MNLRNFRQWWSYRENRANVLGLIFTTLAILLLSLLTKSLWLAAATLIPGAALLFNLARYGFRIGERAKPSGDDWDGEFGIAESRQVDPEVPTLDDLLGRLEAAGSEHTEAIRKARQVSVTVYAAVIKELFPQCKGLMRSGVGVPPRTRLALLYSFFDNWELRRGLLHPDGPTVDDDATV